MAYATKDLNVMQLGFIENTQSIWLYANVAGDSVATIIGAGYVSDGSNKGMKVGDLVIVFNSGGTAANVELLTAASVSSGAFTLGKNVSIS